MPLSQDDQHSLEQIEISLLSDEPRLAHSLDLGAVRQAVSGRRRLAHYGVWIGLATMLIGASLTQGALSMGAIVSCYGLALLAWSTLTIVRCDRMVGPSADPGDSFRPR